MSKNKKYIVIEILNKKELLINYGKNDGARVGEKISISVIGDNVIDPITNENLGTLDILKGRLEIYTVYPEFSICRDIEREERNVALPLGSFTRTNIRFEDLNVLEEDITNRWPQSVPPIKVGDVVTIG